jgi:hypothetical protein
VGDPRRHAERLAEAVEILRWHETAFADTQNPLINAWSAEAAEILRWHETAFADTQNPLYAWSAYNLARTAGVDVPAWVSAYLDAAAEKIWELARRRADRVSFGELAKRIAAALGMKRHRQGERRTIVSDFQGETTQKQIALAAWTHSWSRRHGKPYLEWQPVADHFGVSLATVRRAWNEYKHLFEPPAPGAPEPNPHDK